MSELHATSELKTNDKSGRRFWSNYRYLHLGRSHRLLKRLTVQIGPAKLSPGDISYLEELREFLRSQRAMDEAFERLKLLCEDDSELDDAVRYGMKVRELDRKRWVSLLTTLEADLKRRKPEDALHHLLSNWRGSVVKSKKV